MVRRYAHLAVEHLAVYAAKTKVTAHIRHHPRISAAQPDYKLSCPSLLMGESTYLTGIDTELIGGQGRNRTTDTRIFRRPGTQPEAT